MIRDIKHANRNPFMVNSFLCLSVDRNAVYTRQVAHQSSWKLLT